LYVGRLGYEKQVDILISALAEVIKEVPNAYLNIVGDGPAKKDLIRLVSELKLKKHVKFFGMVKRSNIAKLYQESSVFAIASVFETQGLVILEAMSTGLPVVGVRRFAVGDLIKHGVNGYLVNIGDYKTMSKYLVKILNDTKLQEQLGTEGISRAQKHDNTKTAECLEKLYLSLTNSSKKKSNVVARMTHSKAE
jgi:glycosyltransferase involved in cell wall biosynthesis